MSVIPELCRAWVGGCRPWGGGWGHPQREAGGAEPSLPPRTISACSHWTTRGPPSSCACSVPMRKTPTSSPAPVSAGGVGGGTAPRDGASLPRCSLLGVKRALAQEHFLPKLAKCSGRQRGGLSAPLCTVTPFQTLAPVSRVLPACLFGAQRQREGGPSAVRTDLQQHQTIMGYSDKTLSIQLCFAEFLRSFCSRRSCF